MADNRIYLCYKPSGRVIMLGKRLGIGYFKSPSEEKMEKYFDACEADYVAISSAEDPMVGVDDFILLKENDGNFTYRKGFMDAESPDKFVDFRISKYDLKDE